MRKVGIGREYQGSLDRLCGIYSILNAIRWANPNAQNSPQRLFDCGLGYLIKRKKLNSIMFEGMSRRVWLKMATHIVAEHNRMVDHPLILEKVASLNGADLLSYRVF